VETKTYKRSIGRKTMTQNEKPPIAGNGMRAIPKTNTTKN
jgi:hypothetical protein